MQLNTQYGGCRVGFWVSSCCSIVHPLHHFKTTSSQGWNCEPRTTCCKLIWGDSAEYRHLGCLIREWRMRCALRHVEYMRMIIWWTLHRLWLFSIIYITMHACLVSANDYQWISSVFVPWLHECMSMYGRVYEGFHWISWSVVYGTIDKAAELYTWHSFDPQMHTLIWEIPRGS